MVPMLALTSSFNESCGSASWVAGYEQMPLQRAACRGYTAQCLLWLQAPLLNLELRLGCLAIEAWDLPTSAPCLVRPHLSSTHAPCGNKTRVFMFSLPTKPAPQLSFYRN